MLTDKKIEIKVKFSNQDLWKSALESYFSFNNLFYSFLGFSVFGFGLTAFFLREHFFFPHFIDTIFTAGLFTIFYNLVMSYFTVTSSKTLNNEEFEFIFTDNEVVIISKNFKSFMIWKNFVRVKETAKYFVLSTKSGQKQIIPKKFLAENDLLGFKKLLAEKLGKEAYLKKAKGNLGLK